MNHKRLALVLLIGLMAGLVLSGCGRGTFVKVNGDTIGKDEFYRRLETWPLGRPSKVGPAGLVVLDQLVTEKLYEQLAKEAKVYPTDKQINEKMEFEKKVGTLAATLQQRGITLEELKKEMIPQQALLNVVTKGVNVTEDEVRAYYEKNKDQYPYGKPERTFIGAIICATKPKILEAQQRIKDGTDFSTVALHMSEDPRTRREGGRLGWVWPGMSNVPKNLIEAAFRLKINQVSEPFEVKQKNSAPQWVILRALDRKPKSVLRYADARKQIRESIAYGKGMKQMDINAILQKKRKEADVNVRPERYKILEKIGKEEQKPKKKGKG